METTAAQQSEPPRPTTPAEWASWLGAEEQRTLKKYTDYPELLIADGQHERQIAGDYAGREILELLQNANDAAADDLMRGRVHIELLPIGLLIANEGAGFTTAGVDSLRLANLSPKRSRQRQTIGNKGLGFRAVLNWTRKPIVLSGGLSLAFSTTASESCQRKLADIETLRVLISSEQQTSGRLIVPLLAFPGFTADGDLSSLLDDEAQRGLYGRARELRAAGFTTVVAMPFDRAERSLANARAQLSELRPEVLLFARNIAALEIRDGDRPPMKWRHECDGVEASRVHVGEFESREWRLFPPLRGAVPDELLPSEKPRGMEYEIILAVPTNHTAQNGKLYSYFPTMVDFPYPVVAHATLDLEANRNQPQDTDANKFIVAKLAAFLAETAETLARETNSDAGLRLLAGTSGGDSLARFEFRGHLRSAAQTRALIPTAADGLVKAADARQTTFADTSWLPKRHFRNVAMTRDEGARKVLRWLDVPEMGPQDWADVKLDFESINERADYIAGIVRNGVTAVDGLLLDSLGIPVPSKYKVFLKTAAQVNSELPKWYEARFLHEELRTALWSRLQPGRQDVFTVLLAPLGLMSYSLATLAAELVSACERRISDCPGTEDATRHELLRALHGLFCSHATEEDRPKFPSTRVVLKTLAGGYEAARELYLSSAYGTQGRILEDLYIGFASGKLLALPDALGFVGAGYRLAEFFLWLGVNDLPRQVPITADNVEREFNSYVRHCLPTPLIMENYIFENSSQPSGTCSKVVTLDGLQGILGAQYVAVLAWLATDTRAPSWGLLSEQHGRFGYRQGGDHNTRYYAGGIPSYIRWKLQTTAWLPTRGSVKVKPQDCLAEAVPAIEGLLPMPMRPTNEEMHRYGLARTKLRSAFDAAGVLPGFSDIEPEQLYELLESLPQRDEFGKYARGVYEAVLNPKHFQGAELRASAARERFVRRGKILARSGSEHRYCAVSDVWHMDTDDLPPALVARFNIAALPKRAAATRVKEIFGVQGVERHEIIRRVREPQLVPEADAVQDEIECLRPLIRFLRQNDTRRPREMEAFEKLRVVLCASVVGEVEFQGQVEPIELRPWKWLLVDETHTAYVLTNPETRAPLQSDLFANAIGEIFADVFNLENGDSFARLVRCQRSDRRELLKSLTGREDVPDENELERRHREESAERIERDRILPPSALNPQIVVSRPLAPLVIDPPLPLATAIDGTPLVIETLPHVPAPLPQAIECKVTRRVTVGPRILERTCRVTNGTFCEAKVMEFESSDTPARFPIPVGQVTGLDAPGVDVLSFESEEKRRLFLSAEKRDWSLVARFIEVKGRKDGAAKIDLRDNALTAAREHKGRYYLYRVFDRGDGTYGLAILKNPLHDARGTRQYYEINLDAAVGTEEYDLTGGMTETAYMAASLPPA